MLFRSQMNCGLLKLPTNCLIPLLHSTHPPFCFWLQVKHSKTSASSYDEDFQELIGTYNGSRNFRGKGQKIVHEVEPESESSSYESLDDSASDDEDAIADINKTNVAKSLVKENTEHELDQYPGVDDFDGNERIIFQLYDYLLLRGRCMASVI